MNHYKPNSKVSTTISILCVSVIIALLANWFRFSAEEAIINTTLSEMEEIGIQQEYAVEREIVGAKEALHLLAEHIAKNDVPDDDIIDFLNSQSQTNGFDSLYYLDLDGSGVSVDNKKVDYSQAETFIYAMENDFAISKPHVEPDTQNLLLDIYVPVTKDGEVIAVLLSEVVMDSFFDRYLEETAGKGDIFIVDNKLNLIFSTNKEYMVGQEVLDSDVELLGYENMTKAQADVEEMENGGFYYRYNDVDKVMVYMPIEMTEWALAINVEADVINSEIASAVAQLNYICIMIYWFLIVLIVYTSYYHIRSIKLLEKTAYYDNLTDLPNAAKLKKEMKRILSNNRNKLFTVVKFDIENFKVINEIFGFHVGDEVLKIPKSVMAQQNTPNLIVAKIGIDEYMIFGPTDFLGNIEKRTKTYEAHYKKLLPEIGDYNILFKYGRYNIVLAETDVDDIINKVTLAHNMAKSRKDLPICDYDEKYRNKLLRDADITNKMRAALANGEFSVYLQPKFDINSEELIGAESLVRWVELDGALVFPNEFIPLFEKNGFIVELDCYVLENTCATIKSWMDAGFGGLTVSVNLSRVNLTNPLIVEHITKIVDKYNVPHEYIEIELTESATIEQEEALDLLYVKLHEGGFKTSIDDFGAGYSSLSMLKNLNVDTLKLDKSFFAGGKFVRRDDMLIDGIVKLAHSLGMYVVAEGIETAEQVELLKSMNCDAVQGYFYAKPMPMQEFEETYSQAMRNNLLNEDKSLDVIRSINDAKFANTFVPCGIVVAEMDEYFTITEANDEYFKIVNFTKEDVRDLFDNRGILLIHPDDRERVQVYFAQSIKKDMYAQMSFVCRVLDKLDGYKIVKFIGKVSINENGIHRLYVSFTDITSYIMVVSDLLQDGDIDTIIDRLSSDTTSMDT